MKKNILVITSEYTGCGHKAITDAIEEELSKCENIKVFCVDGFGLGGEKKLEKSKLYGKLTRKSIFLYKVFWKITSQMNYVVNKIISKIIEESLLELIDKLKPNLILSVHPLFNGSIINILEKHNLKIPFITYITDLGSVNKVWMDNRTDKIICTTVQVKNECINAKIDENKINILSYPLRKNFIKNKNYKLKQLNYPLNFLIMSGAEGIGNYEDKIRILIDKFQAKVTVITGRNEKMKMHLLNTLEEKYLNKTQIIGFTYDIHEYFFKSDVAIIRASPGVLMESVFCNLPIIITGYISGQESKNPQYILENKLGVTCYEDDSLEETVNNLLKNNKEKLMEIKNNQMQFCAQCFDKNIGEFLIEFMI